MSEPYEEIIEGERMLRFPPAQRHEDICRRLHAHLAVAVENFPSVQLLPLRSITPLSAGTMLRPDITLITTATSKVWLIGEVINSEDHQPDTVLKKNLYEESKLPRLWMIDPRYDNVEIYHGGPYGLSLKTILAQRDTLEESLLPGFSLTIAELFGLKTS